MLKIVPITPEIVERFKRVRLSALSDSPHAFGSSFARESVLTDADWLLRATKWNSGRSVAYLAHRNGTDCGIVAGFFDENVTEFANLVSMWVAPNARRAGVGRILVNAVHDWAHNMGANEVRLMVTEINHGALRFYESLGYAKTGRTEPWPNDPTVLEFEMSRPAQSHDRST
jgi:GNAT superfamily N-acetyltransferase